MKRRAFIETLAGGLMSAPLAVEAQPANRTYRIGYLSPAGVHTQIDEAFDRSMKDLGYVQGRNMQIERRYIGRSADQLPSGRRGAGRHERGRDRRVEPDRRRRREERHGHHPRCFSCRAAARAGSGQERRAAR